MRTDATASAGIAVMEFAVLEFAEAEPVGV
jgi:hypothetical protein